jgi:hypothetical protein
MPASDRFRLRLHELLGDGHQALLELRPVIDRLCIDVEVTGRLHFDILTDAEKEALTTALVYAHVAIIDRELAGAAGSRGELSPSRN